MESLLLLIVLLPSKEQIREVEIISFQAREKFLGFDVWIGVSWNNLENAFLWLA
jgi:hypothetical protein